MSASTSAIINVMIKACNKAASAIARDFTEVEKLRCSAKNLNKFVCNSDLKSERIIAEELQKARPEFDMLLEESGCIISPYKTKCQNTKTYRWIVDPIDGSFNFGHAHPNFAISIALECVNDAGASKASIQHKSKLGLKGYKDIIAQDYDPVANIVAGVIYIPLTSEIFWAEKGRGAYYINRNNVQNRISVGGRKQYDELAIATHFWHNSSKIYNKIYKLLFNGFARTRASGSTAIDCCFTACGKLDLSVYDHTMLWDIAAGALIIKEAGGNYYFLNDEREQKNENLIKPAILGNQALLDLVLNDLLNIT